MRYTENDLRTLFQHRFDRDKWIEFLKNFLDGARLRSVPEEFHTPSDNEIGLFLGEYNTSDHFRIGLFQFDVNAASIARRRVGLRNLVKSLINPNWGEFDAALAVFISQTDWRLSFICDIKEEQTAPKRFTYVFGDEEMLYRTPVERLLAIQGRVSFTSLRKAFSVKELSDEFFDEYREIYADFVQYITGNRYVKKTQGGGYELKAFPSEPQNRSFYEALGRDDKRARDFVKKMMGRITFLYFLQQKGWMCGDKNYLPHLFETSADKNFFLKKVLVPLFFGVLNTKPEDRRSVFSAHGWNDDLRKAWESIPYLNGGLFEPDGEDVVVSDCATHVFRQKDFENLFEFFGRYNFTIDENDPTDAEIGVDPEMLGKIFESLLEDNKDKGAFYTPKEIVKYMCQQSLVAYLVRKTGLDEDCLGRFVHNPELVVNEFNDTEQCSILDAILKVKICDPAIGSGAFPIGLLNELVMCKEAIYGDRKGRAAIKREIIRDNIYGVDIEKGAVDIARLRFWLSLVVDEEEPTPLPNLDYKIMQGNSLIPTFNGKYVNLSDNLRHINSSKIQIAKKELYRLQNSFYDAEGVQKKKLLIEIKYQILEIVKLQMDYEYKSEVESNALSLDLFSSSPQKTDNNKIKEKSDIVNKCILLQQELINSARSVSDRYDIDIPFFDWRIMFPDVFNIENNNGFDIVIGNPPYGLINKRQNQGEGIIVPDEILEVYKTMPEYSDARGGMLNIFRLFVIQGGRLLSDKGVFCEIFPLAFTCDLSSAKLREHIFTNYRVLSIEAFPERDNPQKRVFSSAKVSVCILTYAKELQANHKFALRINREPYVEESKESSQYSLEHIMAIDSKYLTIPLTETMDSDILKKVYSNSFPFGDINKCYTGEIDMTFCKKAFTKNPSDCKMLRGAHVDRYIERKEISQGETLYLNPQTLQSIKSSLNESLFRTPRIIMQGITGVNERTRLKMTLVSNTFCANSVNYCLFESMDEAKFYLGLFNSRLLNYVFKLLSTNSNVNGYEVDNLPIANSVSETDRQNIIDIVTQILNYKNIDINYDTLEEEKQLDNIVYKLYGMTPQDIKVIESY